MKHSKLIITILILAISGSSVFSDTPANWMRVFSLQFTFFSTQILIIDLINKGTYEVIKGAWKIYEGPRGQSKHFDCTNYTNLTNNYYIYLSFPDIATDDQGLFG